MGRAKSRGRKKPQQTSATQPAASGPEKRSEFTKAIVWILIILLIAGAVVGGVLFTNSRKNRTEGVVINPTSAAAPAYPVRRDGVVVVSGKDDAKVTIDVYEDFLCPHCKAFEEANAQAIERELRNGTLRVRYHLLAILNAQSDPPGYSLESANAAICVTDPGQFTPYHASLFRAQPDEGARGYDKNQLIRLGTDLGVTTPDFATCVNTTRHAQGIEAAQQQASETPYLQQDFGDGKKGFGTPTVAVGDQMVDTSDPTWLEKLISQT